MDIDTIKKLNQVNLEFYSEAGKDFDKTRQQYWEGWERLLPQLHSVFSETTELSVLDLGCGNGRFGRFLADYLPSKTFMYHGVDSNHQLLSITVSALRDKAGITSKTDQLDVVTALLEDTVEAVIHDQYDLVVMFGVLHHIPSENLRKKLLKILLSAVKPGGLLILSSWQFATLPRFSSRFIDPAQFNVNPETLEKNDYFLDWQRGTVAYRYCHFADEAELRFLIRDVSQLEPIDVFYADGNTHNLNCYAVVQKSI